MQIDIFYRSYHKDYPWLAYSLLSTKKYAVGFNKVHVAVPADDIACVPVCDAEEVHLVTDRCPGYLAQQVTKLYADEFCKSEYILHVDSDCVWNREMSPWMFFIGDKPVMLREEGVDSPWSEIAVESLGWRDKGEYMRRLPIIYPRWLYGAFRKWMEQRHGMSLGDWIGSRRNNRFSEFNTLGQWAYKYHHDAFEWLHPAEFPIYMRQYRSWDGLNDEIRKEIEISIAK
jgi:hypothetical protein